MRVRGDSAASRRDTLDSLGCRVVDGGLADPTALLALVQGADLVFHVAGLVAARSERDFVAVNRDGTAALAGAALAAGAGRLVLVSSLAVTGPSRPGELRREEAGPGPLTRYARSKHAAERAARDSGVPLTIVRPPAVYGPRDRAFLPLFRAAARGFVPLLGDPKREITVVHAADLARALVAAGESPATLGRVYHAGNPRPVAQRELAEAVGRAVGRPVRPVTVPSALVRIVLATAGAATRAIGRAPLLDGDKARELLAPGWACSSEALRRDTGWTAGIPLEAGLAATAGSYREAGWL